jgi:hypothetical protein
MKPAKKLVQESEIPGREACWSLTLRWKRFARGDRAAEHRFAGCHLTDCASAARALAEIAERVVEAAGTRGGAELSILRG